MTKNELKELITEMVSECISEEKEINEYQSMYESYMMLENSIYQDIINEYSSDKFIYESYVDFIDEAFIINRKSYNTKEEAEKGIEQEISSIREKIKQYREKLKDIEANPNKYDDDAAKVINNKIKSEEELIVKRKNYLTSELNKQLDNVKDTATQAASNSDNKEVASKAAAQLKNPETKNAITQAVDNATPDNASQEEVKEKVADNVASKFPGLKAVKGNIVSTFKGENGKAKQYLAIAGLATAIVGSITAAVMIRKKKKAKQQEAEKNK